MIGVIAKRLKSSQPETCTLSPLTLHSLPPISNKPTKNTKLDTMTAQVSTDSLVWIAASGGESVDDAIVAGTAADGAELHIARAPIDPEIAPGKLHVGYECAYIPLHEVEETAADYEVLANPGGVELEWVGASGGDVPIGAVAGGTCGQGEPIYLSRCSHEDEVIPGKLVPRTGAAYVPWSGNEYTYEEYEVLCVKTVTPESC